MTNSTRNLFRTILAIYAAGVVLAFTMPAHAGQSKNDTVQGHAVDYGFITRPHNGYWQIACFARDYGREFLTMPWQGKFATRGAAERFARANVDCDY